MKLSFANYTTRSPLNNNIKMETPLQVFSVECSLTSTEAGAMNLLPTNCTKFPESNEEEEEDDDFDKKENHHLEVLQHCS